MFEFITELHEKWKTLKRNSVKHEYRLTSYFGGSVEVRTFSCTQQSAEGATIKAWAYHEADKAVLEQLIGDKWWSVYFYPDRKFESG